METKNPQKNEYPTIPYSNPYSNSSMLSLDLCELDRSKATLLGETISGDSTVKDAVNVEVAIDTRDELHALRIQSARIATALENILAILEYV